MGHGTENRDRIASYLASGARSECGLLGLEVEHFIVSETGEPLYYEPHDGLIGVRDVLAELSRDYPNQTKSPKGDLLGLADEKASITIEPAAQIEISVAPFPEVARIGEVYRAFRSKLDAYVQEHGCKVLSVGYNPLRCALDMPIIPKERYKFMDRHFTEIGTHGHRMMRASASTQVSIDYVDERDAVRKMRIANALAPVLAAICDNTAVFEGKPVREPLARLLMWRDVDPVRCQVVPTLYDPDFGFGAYADWLLDMRPIFVMRPQGPGEEALLEPDAGRTTRQIYANEAMDVAAIEHAMSMVWPDVRLKHFVEIRPADSLPFEEALGYVALIKGLFYNQDSLAAIENMLGVKHGIWPIDAAAIEDAIEAIRAGGMAAQVFGQSLAEWESALFGWADAALNDQEQGFLQALKGFALDKPWA